MKAIALLHVILTGCALIGVLGLTYVHVWARTLTWTNFAISSVFITMIATIFIEAIKEFNELKNK